MTTDFFSRQPDVEAAFSVLHLGRLRLRLLRSPILGVFRSSPSHQV